AEEAVTLRLGVSDDAAERLRVDQVLRTVDLDPAALAPQIAAVDDRDVQEGREVFAAGEPPLELLDRPDPLEPEVVAELPEDLRVGLPGDACGERRQHHHEPCPERLSACSSFALI